MANPAQVVVSQSVAPRIDIKSKLPEKIEVRTESQGRVSVNPSPVTITGGSSGPFYLSQLSDVQITSPAQGDLISYNQSNLKWINIKQSAVTDGGNF